MALAALLLGACQTGDGLTLPSDGEPAAIAVVDGDGQSGRVTEALANPVVVQVTDSRGRPVENATVAFNLTSAGAAVTPQTTTTDADGRAQAQVVLGTAIGTLTGQAQVVINQGASGPATAFTATALPEGANEIAAVSGEDQAAPVGSPLPSPLVVQVTDNFGNPISGIPIEWTVDGGGSVSVASTTTDDRGRAAVARTLGGSVGRQTTFATSEGLAGSPVTFVHTAIAGNATTVGVVSGNNQVAVAGTLLPAAAMVRVVDGSGNGVPGTAVTWVVSIGGGSVTPENGRTDDQGFANAQWTLGPQPGDNRLDAVVSGVGVANFKATGTTDPANLPARIELSGGNGQTGTAGTTLPTPLSVKVTTGSGAPAANVTVNWAASGGGSISSATSVTNTGGIAQVLRTLGSSPGTQTTTASAAGLTGSPVTFQSTATAGAPSALSLTTQPAETARNGVRLARQPVIQIRDGAGNPVHSGGVDVAVAIGSGGGILSGTTHRTTGGDGKASFNDLSITGAPGPRTLIFAATGFTGVVSNPIELTAAATTTRITSDGPDPSAAGAPVTVTFTVTSEGPTPAGSVTVSDGVDTCTGGLANGAGSCPLALSTAGDRTLTATYGGAEGQLGSSGTASHRVTPPNQPPVASFSPDCHGLHCKFNDTSTDSDGKIASRSWTFGDGGTDGGKDPSHDYAASNTYTVTLTVTDDDGATGTATQQVTVTAPPPPNQPPTAEFTWNCTFLDCNFTDGSSDSDGTIASWVWNFDDGTGSTDQNPTHSYTTGKTYHVKLIVTDNGGLDRSITHDVSVTGPPPPNQAPNASFTHDPCTAGTPCQFTDTSTDDDGTVSGWSWNFGDPASDPNNTSPDQSPTHSFSAPGDYSVTLTVTDNDGTSSTVSTQTFTVN